MVSLTFLFFFIRLGNGDFGGCILASRVGVGEEEEEEEKDICAFVQVFW